MRLGRFGRPGLERGASGRRLVIWGRWDGHQDRSRLYGGAGWAGQARSIFRERLSCREVEILPSKSAFPDAPRLVNFPYIALPKSTYGTNLPSQPQPTAEGHNRKKKGCRSVVVSTPPRIWVSKSGVKKLLLQIPPPSVPVSSVRR